MSILLIAGSPSERSRSAALLDAVQLHLALRGAEVERVLIRDLSPQALVLADVAHPSIAQAVAKVARAQAIVVATPIYKAAYSGVLKLFLDLLPQTAFKGKTVLPMATGGSPNHMLALDYALRPVLQSLGADHILSGVFATDGQVVLLPPDGHQLDDDLAQRLHRAAGLLPVSKDWGKHAANAPIHFSRVRCSV
nr:NADPH-dependent FMN reductase [uncultured Albidiferax sp.]